MGTQPQIQLDQYYFPRIWIPEIDAYMYWLPITKIQFEYYLCDPSCTLEATWYEEILSLNPRITPTQISKSNYWQAFISGILPHEARGFSAWSGQGCRLMSSSEWITAFTSLEKLSAIDINEVLSVMGDKNPRACTLIRELNSVRPITTKISEQVFMMGGVREWVSHLGTEHWGAVGTTSPLFHAAARRPTDFESIDTLSQKRRKDIGFRLIWRPTHD